MTGFMQNPAVPSVEPPSSLPIIPTEAMAREAEVEAAYLALEAARADPIYRSELQAKATEARERAYRLRATMARGMCGED